jgi:hypothetical protein
MSYRIAQDFHYVGHDYWHWRAWIEAAPEELDAVREVAWILHPSFSQARVVVSDRATGFRLETSGWGTFLLRAELLLADGRTVALRHRLQLAYPDEADTAAPTRSAAPREAASPAPRSVFLSYSTADARAAGRLRERLQKAGVVVLDQSRVGVGEPWQEALQRMIVRSDAVIGLVDDAEVSPWVSAEMQTAMAAAKPTLALMGSGASRAGLPSEVPMLQVDVRQIDPDTILEALDRQAPV